MGPCRHTAIAVRCAMTVPAHLKCSLTRPSSRPGSGAVDRPFYPCITPCCLYRVDSVVNSPAKLPVGPTDRVVRCPRPVMAGRRERRRPAEATPLGQLRVWTTLFGPFTGGTWERQAPPRGAPSGTTPPAGRGGPGPFTPLRCPGLGEGSPAVTNPRGTRRVHVAGRSSILGLVTAHSRAP